MAIEFRCKCGLKYSVKEHNAGRRFDCQQCGQKLLVPNLHSQQSVVLAPISAKSAPIKSPNPLLQEHGSGRGNQNIHPPHSISRFLASVFAVWAVSVLTSMLVYRFYSGFLGWLLFIGITLPLTWAAIQVAIAKRHVLSDRKEFDLLFGLAKLVSWDPTEGVLLLKNKSVGFVDDSLEDGGGIRLLYPILGEEIACRVPLEIQTLSVQDDQVMTREYLPLQVNGTIKWRIVDLRRFYLLMSREIHVASDRGKPVMNSYLPDQPAASQMPLFGANASQLSSLLTASRKLEAASHWLRLVAEEQTRSIASKLSTGLLVAEQVAADLPPEMRAQLPESAPSQPGAVPVSTDSYIATSDGLGIAIKRALEPRVNEFGIDIHEVSLQEVRLPQHIHEAAVEACKASYIPLVAQKKALGRKIELEAEAEVLGVETVGAREVVANAPAYSLADFLGTFLSKNRSMLGAVKKQAKSVSREKPPERIE
jgi:regulator of protease activity HflC (stomatin/prohibitin superfamily)